MANGTLKVSNIETSSGSGTITIGQSGETVTIPSGTTVSGAMANTPAFLARLSSSQSVSSGTWTKININTKIYDTASGYDNSSNYRWTPGVAGKYIIYGQAGFDSMSDQKYMYVTIQKNGNQLWTDGSAINHATDSSVSLGIAARTTWSVELGASDYIEMYAYHNYGSNRNASTGWCYFGGYKIIE